MVFLWRIFAVGAGESAADRYLVDDELHALLRGGFCIGRIHHAGCRLRVAAAVHALNRSIRFFHCGLSPYDARIDVRILQKTQRVDLGVRYDDFHRVDGRGVCGLRPPVGTDVLLGCAGDHLFVRRHTGCG